MTNKATRLSHTWEEKFSCESFTVSHKVLVFILILPFQSTYAIAQLQNADQNMFMDPRLMTLTLFKFYLILALFKFCNNVSCPVSLRIPPSAAAANRHFSDMQSVSLRGRNTKPQL